MAKKKKDDNKSPATVAQSDAAVGSGVNAPDLDPKTLEVGLRSIKDGLQAHSIAQALEQANETRNKKNAIIWRKYNGDPPYDQKALIDAQEDWRSNASFGFLSGIVSRVVPAPVQIIDSARYLTSAALKSKEGEAAGHTEVFRSTITKAIRKWDGWKSFNYALAQEDVLIGGGLVAWLDDYDPFPRFFRQDEAFVPDGTLQQAKNVQLFVAKQSWLIHEAVEFIKDGKDSADAAGWDVEEMVNSINEAMPKNPSSDGNTAGHSRSYEDTVREGNIGQSYSTGARTVEVYQIFAVEADGKVTQYIVDRRGNHKVLYQKDDRYDSMQDQLSLFTLEPGNGKFYSSKGLGRMLINMHISIERLRNVIIDNVYLAGLLVLQADPNKGPSIQTKLIHPFIVTTTDAQFVEHQIQLNVDEFLQLDSKITQLAEIAAGAYIPDKLTSTGERDKTATEASIDANREQQAKIAFLARYWGQLGDMVSNIQKKLCQKDSSHPAVKEVREQLLEAGLVEEEIDELSNCPAAEVVQDMTQTQNSQKVAVFEALKGDPKVNQDALYRMGVTAMSTPEVADSVLIPEEFDQTVEAEAMRLQMLENDAMMSGNPMPISPRDNHEVHLNTLAGQLKQDWPGVKQNASQHPEMLDSINLAMNHAKAHIDTWKQLGAKPEQTAPYEKALDMLDKEVMDTVKGIQDQKQQQAEQQQEQQQQMGPPNPTADPTQPQPPHPAQVAAQAKISESINYKDAPDDIKRQMEAAAGFIPSKVGAIGNSTATADQTRHVANTVSAVKNVGALHAAVNQPQPPQPQGPLPAPPQAPVAPPEPQGVPPAAVNLSPK